MRDRRRCAGIGGGAHAGLVGEESPLDAEHHAGSGKTSEDCLEVKSVCQNDSQHRGDPGDISDDNKDADQNIEAGHDRHQDRGDFADNVARKEDHQRTDCQDDTDHSGNYAG